MNLAHYAKTWGPLVVALAIAAFTFTRDTEPAVGVQVYVFSFVLALINVIVTYSVRNADQGFWAAAKAWANIAHVGLQALIVAISATVCACLAGLTLQDWSGVALAALGAIVVWIFPNEPELVAVGQHDDGSRTSVYSVPAP